MRPAAVAVGDQAEAVTRDMAALLEEIATTTDGTLLDGSGPVVAAALGLRALVMSLVVGLFEAVFLRGFIQGRLEASFGAASAVAGAAVLYALYHIGYGMGDSHRRGHLPAMSRSQLSPPTEPPRRRPVPQRHRSPG